MSDTNMEMFLSKGFLSNVATTAPNDDHLNMLHAQVQLTPMLMEARKMIGHVNIDLATMDAE